MKKNNVFIGIEFLDVEIYLQKHKIQFYHKIVAIHIINVSVKPTQLVHLLLDAWLMLLIHFNLSHLLLKTGNSLNWEINFDVFF